MSNLFNKLICISLLALSCTGIARAAEVVPYDDFRSKTFTDNATSTPQSWKSFASIFDSYETQNNQAFCGIASSVIILNSLGIKGENYVESWYPYLTINQHSIFTGNLLSVKSSREIEMSGLTLDELGAILATIDAVQVKVVHATPELGFQRFRDELVAALTNPNSRVIVNFLREKLHQEGHGHHSPLAGYDPVTQRVLVMDVARYKTITAAGATHDGSGRPFWVTIEDLWSALNTEDQVTPDTKMYRGFVVITKKAPH